MCTKRTNFSLENHQRLLRLNTNSTAIRSGKLLVVRLHKWFSNEHQNVWIITLKWWNTMVNSWNKSNNQIKFNWYLPNKFGWTVFYTMIKSNRLRDSAWAVNESTSKTNVTRMKYNLAQLSRADNRSRTKQWYSNTKITLSTNGSTSNLENEKLHRNSLAGYPPTCNAPQATGSPPKKRWKSDSLWRT